MFVKRRICLGTIKKELAYQGKAKKVFKTNYLEVLWIEYLDQATALNGARKDEIVGKAELNNQISSIIFEELTRKNIRNHLIKKISKTEQLVTAVEIFPLEVVIRNISAGSFSKRLGVPEGVELLFPVLEFYYKDDPFINEEHIKILSLATDEELKQIKEQAYTINQELISLFEQINLVLVDFKIEFGKTNEGIILLADEITPDTCRLWDKTTGEPLDKDVYRKNIGDIVPVYQEVLHRLEETFVQERGK